jgi:transposase
MSTVSYRDILRHRRNGMSMLEIHRACGCAKSTVQEVLSKAARQGVAWEDVASLSEDAARELVNGRKSNQDLYYPVDCERIWNQMRSDRTMTLAVLWEEYAAEAVGAGKRPYLYSRFCDFYRGWRGRNDISASKRHVPGDVAEFDWAGQTMEVADGAGGAHPAYLFVACLPYSQYTYVKAFPSMAQDWWIEGSIGAYEFFRGVPRITVIDNLKTGVTKHSRDEIALNRTFREFAEHYNTAVIPHAPARPTGKASVESNVGKIANRIRLALRNRVFFSFEELNEAIATELDALNAKPFQRRDGSRTEVFERDEAPCLMPLPARRYETAKWGPKVVVPRNYHVRCNEDGVYYSVPWRLVGEKVETRVTRGSVEVFCGGERVATHRRDANLPKGSRVTDPSHMPKSHADWVGHDSGWYRERAAEVGPACSRVVEGFLAAGTAEEQGWQWCEKLLRKLETRSPATVEDVCALAVAATGAPSYKTVNTLFKSRDARDHSAAALESGRADDERWAIRRFK